MAIMIDRFYTRTHGLMSCILLYRCLIKGSNKIFYSLCEWGRENPAAWAPKIGANSWRISADIRDSWSSIVTRADITASLWRYSGPSAGWNDPDMLEVGNGKCTEVCNVFMLSMGQDRHSHRFAFFRRNIALTSRYGRC